MQVDDAKALLDELAPRPSAKTWRWIQRALMTLDPTALDGIVEYAEPLLAAWPDELRDGQTWHDGELAADFSKTVTSPLWRLVRSLSGGGYFTPLPSMTDGGVASQLTGLELTDLGAQAIGVLTPWAGLGHLRRVHLASWSEYEPGWATMLLDGLDPTKIESLRLTSQGPALDEVIERITSAEWPALVTLGLPECRDEHLDALARAFGGRARSLQLHTSGFSDEGVVRVLAELGGPQLESLTLGRDRRPLDVSWASSIARSAGLRRLEARFAEGALAGFVAQSAATHLTSLRFAYESEVGAGDLAAFGGWPGASALRELVTDSGSRIDDEALGALARSAHLNALETLSLRLCAFGEAGARLWAERASSGLQALIIDGVAELGDLGGCALVESAPASLKTLMLPRCGVGEKTAVALASAAPRLEQLIEIDLSYGTVGLNGLRTILESSLAPQLEGLHLEGGLDSPEVGPEGLAAIAERVDGLRRLSLAGQGLDYDGLLQTLEASPGLQRLEELDLRGNDAFFDVDTLRWELEDLGVHVHELRAGSEV